MRPLDRSGRTRVAALAGLLLCGLSLARAGDYVRYRLRDIEVVGTDKLSPDLLRERLKEPLKAYLLSKSRKGAQAARKTEQLQASIEKAARELGGLPWVRLETSEAGREGSATDVVLTFEAVEQRSMAARLPFRGAPTGSIKDPTGLLDAWQRYQDLGWSLVGEAKISIERADCPAFYCTWGAATPELQTLQRRFMAEVPEQVPMLDSVLREDADPARRARALYLMSYRREGGEVAVAAAYGMQDPDPAVREAALLILNDISIHHTEIPLPLPQVIRMLDYPFAEDRERAMALLISVGDRKEARPLVLEAAPKVVELLKLKNPSNHSMAYTLLGILSGEKYSETDYAAWESWARKAREDGDK